MINPDIGMELFLAIAGSILLGILLGYFLSAILWYGVLKREVK